MLVGHVAVGLTAKRIEPVVSLGTWVLAAMTADVLWCVFMIAGIEQVDFVSGRGAAHYFIATNIALSHSLLLDVVWGVLFGSVYYVLRRNLRNSLLLFGVVLSHWVLDVISHGPDMPLAPGIHRYLGLSLWASIPASVIVEGGFWLFALIYYVRASRAKKRLGNYVYWIGAAILTLAWYNNLTGPPPQDPKAAPVASLIFFSAIVAWAYWVNRLRVERQT